MLIFFITFAISISIFLYMSSEDQLPILMALLFGITTGIIFGVLVNLIVNSSRPKYPVSEEIYNVVSLENGELNDGVMFELPNKKFDFIRFSDIDSFYSSDSIPFIKKVLMRTKTTGWFLNEEKIEFYYYLKN